MAKHSSQESFFRKPSEGMTGVCVICSKTIEHDTNSIVHRTSELRCAYGQCEDCRLAYITVEIGDAGMKNSVSVMTDWKHEEVSFFWSKDTVSSNDVLELHKALQSPSFETQCIESFNQS